MPAVSDGDVGERIQMCEGYVYNAQIIGVKKGQKGNPGELSGMIRYQSADCLGTIEENMYARENPVSKVLGLTLITAFVIWIGRRRM